VVGENHGCSSSCLEKDEAHVLATFSVRGKYMFSIRQAILTKEMPKTVAFATQISQYRGAKLMSAVKLMQIRRPKIIEGV